MPEVIASGGWVRDGQLPGRVVFAVGAVDQVAQECDRLEMCAVLVIGGESAREPVARVATGLGSRLVGTHTKVVQHVPEELASLVVERARQLGADGVVTIGGGSATGLGKVVALRLGLPTVAVPTTYAGSEMTPVYGITGPSGKQTGSDARVVPRAVLYDPALVVSLPRELTAGSGMNAVAHCVHALWGSRSDPFAHAFAEHGLRVLGSSLPDAVRAPDDLEARLQTLVGASMAGAALATAGTGLHHRIAHALGGSHGLSHSAVHSAVLPQVVAANSAAGDAVNAALSAISRSLTPSGRPEDAVATVFDFATRLGAPTRLADLGLRQRDLPAVVAAVEEKPADNPVALSHEALVDLLQAAWEGRRPSGPR